MGGVPFGYFKLLCKKVHILKIPDHIDRGVMYFKHAKFILKIDFVCQKALQFPLLFWIEQFEIASPDCLICNDLCKNPISKCIDAKISLCGLFSPINSGNSLCSFSPYPYCGIRSKFSAPQAVKRAL